MPDKSKFSDLNAALLRYKNGDDGAFDIILEKMRMPLIFFINGYVDNINDAEDICMDVFASLLLNINKFSFRSSLSTYLFILARNKAVDYIRHKKAVRTESLDENTSDSDFSNVEAEYIRSEEYRRLHDELRAMPEKYRTVLYLAYFEDMDTDEIALVMKKSKKQVYNLMFRAKAELRTRMEGGKD